ncbi:hypothetical protein [uncultured Psychrobacter sp.]|uniref:hypothetical protein n=1 Tax=uncultured Psychrobacter sp. TaxID=259303 RepID=UPI0030DBAD2F
MSTVFEGLNHHWVGAMREAEERARDKGDHQEEARLMAEVKERATEHKEMLEIENEVQASESEFFKMEVLGELIDMEELNDVEQAD